MFCFILCFVCLFIFFIQFFFFLSLQNPIRLNLQLAEGVYYWAVSANNGLSGPLSDISAFIICVSVPPRFFKFIILF